MITSHQWSILKGRLPEELQPLCIMCMDYAEEMYQLTIVSPSLTGADIAGVQSQIHQILSEYIKIIRVNLQLSEKEIERVEQDIASNLTAFFDGKERRVKSLAADFRLAKERNQIDLHFPLFMAPFTAFIDSRIYQSLRESYVNSQKGLIKLFVTSTIKKAGIIPRPEKESSIFGSKSSKSEEDDD